jgi:hypothetical protein
VLELGIARDRAERGEAEVAFELGGVVLRVAVAAIGEVRLQIDEIVRLGALLALSLAKVVFSLPIFAAAACNRRSRVNSFSRADLGGTGVQALAGEFHQRSRL